MKDNLIILLLLLIPLLGAVWLLFGANCKKRIRYGALIVSLVTLLLFVVAFVVAHVSAGDSGGLRPAADAGGAGPQSAAVSRSVAELLAPLAPDA